MIQNIDLGKTPISEDNPSGEDPKYDPLFESISGEIGKIGSPTADSPPDWSKIVSESEAILSEKAKHLLIGCYLCIGLFKTDGLTGLSGGIRVLSDMIAVFWDSFFPPPKRMKGRVNAISWWYEKLQHDLESFETVIWPQDQRDQLIQALKGLDENISEKMPDAPMLKPMIDRIDRLIEVAAAPPQETPETKAPETTDPAMASDDSKKPEIKSEQKSKPSTTKKTTQITNAVPPPATEMSSSDDPDHLLDTYLNALGNLATVFRQNDPFDHRAFRLSRMAAWMGISAPPPATGGKSMIPPPNAQVISILKTAFSSGNWQNLLDGAESYIRQYLFWLDLSFYVHTALDNLNHLAARDMVALETRSYVSRIPGITEIAFSDGTPFASTDTRLWLTSIASTSTHAESESANNIASTISDVISSSEKSIRDNRLDDAIKPVQNGLLSATSAMERYQWTMGLVELLIHGKLYSVLGPHIDKLTGMIEAHQLSKWDPALAVKGMTVAVTGLRLSDPEGESDKINSLIRQIALIDPVSAVGIMP